MRLFICRSILKREFAGSLPPEAIEVLRRALRFELMVPIRGAQLPSGTRLLKAYATSLTGPKRIIFLFLVQREDVFLLFCRAKTDTLGANMTVKNPKFKQALVTYLRLLRRDIDQDAVEEILLGNR